MYDTGLVSGEDSTTIGEGRSTFLRPGFNAVTDPILPAPLVICVGARFIMPVCLTTEVFATGCPNASGAIIAQTKTIVIRLDRDREQFLFIMILPFFLPAALILRLRVRKGRRTSGEMSSA